jgi:hypothetical protein
MNVPADRLVELSLDPGDPEGVAAVDPEQLPEQEHFLGPGEAEQLQRARLAAIRKAIADGSYDTPEMLDKALRRMLPRIEDSGDGGSA